MIFNQTKWQIAKIANTACKNIKNLNPETQRTIIENLEALQLNPFDQDIKKIEGHKDIFRVRIGDYRFYFRMIRKSKSIEILLFEKRGSIKKKSIQRLK